MQVTVHSRPGCMPCKLTKDALDRAGVPFIEEDISEYEAAAMHKLRTMGHRQLPVVVVRDADGAVVDEWSGFIPPSIQSLAARYADGDSE